MCFILIPFFHWFELFLLYAVFLQPTALLSQGISVSVLCGWVQHIYLFTNSFVHSLWSLLQSSLSSIFQVSSPSVGDCSNVTSEPSSKQHPVSLWTIGVSELSSAADLHFWWRSGSVWGFVALGWHKEVLEGTAWNKNPLVCFPALRECLSCLLCCLQAAAWLWGHSIPKARLPLQRDSSFNLYRIKESISAIEVAHWAGWIGWSHRIIPYHRIWFWWSVPNGIKEIKAISVSKPNRGQ